MSADNAFDAIIVGAGQAGPPLAARLTAAGQTVALIEQGAFGGTCVNVGCMPTKALLATARVAHQMRHAADFGIQYEGPVSVDMQAVLKRKDEIVRRSSSGVESWVSRMEGCTIFRRHARFLSPSTMTVDGHTIAGRQIFINVGGRASIPNLPGLERVSFLTNVSIMKLDTLPPHLVIIGGSYVGLEFAQMYRRFGSEVTVLEKAPRLLSREDEDVSKAIRSILEDEGVTVRTGTSCVRVSSRGANVIAHIDCAGDARDIVGSHLLVAVGRRPNTDDLAIENAGVALDEHGYVVVDDQLRTNVDGIWALGDCNGRGAFTHTSYNDFEIVAANLLDGQSRRLSTRIPCYALFIDPPLGRVGLTEQESRAAGRRVKVATRPMTRVGRAIEEGATKGFMKVVVDSDTNKILGAAIVGLGGDEVVHGILDTMSAGASYRVLQQTMHIHPTVSELVPTLLGDLA